MRSSPFAYPRRLWHAGVAGIRSAMMYLAPLLVALAGGSLPAAAQVPARPMAQSPSPTAADEVRARMARGELPAALQRVDAALAARPGDAQLLFLRGVVLMDLGRDDAALEAFRSLHQSYPELPEPLNNIGLLQARAGQLEAAQQSLQNALRADPGHRAARTNLGHVYLMLAVQAWEQVAAAAPADAGLLRRLESARALLAGPPR
jgi:Flp pilus assembly protein TadD